MTSGVEVAVGAHAELGEGPIWWAGGGRVLWVDIKGRALHRYDPARGTNETTIFDDTVSLVVPRAGGGFVLGLGNAVVLLDEDLAETRRLRVEDDPANRTNDGGCDAAGRLWIGTMRRDGEGAAGTLYRVDPDGTITPHATDLGIPNGIAWSPDGRRMYHIDTPTRRVDVYDYGPATGVPRDRRPVVEFPEDYGHPDGMTVDAEGCLWVAFYGGWAVRRFTPAGELDRQVDLPVEKVTSCAFGGRRLDELYISTATEDLDAEALAAQPLAGSLFRMQPGVQGIPPYEFAG